MTHWIARAREWAAERPGSPYSSDRMVRATAIAADHDLLVSEFEPDRTAVLVRLLRAGDQGALAAAERWDAENRAWLIGAVRKATPCGRGAFAASYGIDTAGLRAALREILTEANPGGHAEYTALLALWQHGDDASFVLAYLRVPACECGEPGWELPPEAAWTCADCAACAAEDAA